MLRDWMQDSLSWRSREAWYRVIGASHLQQEEKKCRETEDEIFSDKQLIKGLIQVSY